jgi:hypothetical protein
MKSQVRGPSAAKQFMRWLHFKKDAAPIEVKILRGGFQNWHGTVAEENPELIENLSKLDEDW